MTKEEIDCDDPENKDHPDCQCDGYDEDQAYDAYIDGIVEDYFDRLDERQGLYKKLLLCDYHGNHNKDRDDLEKQLLKNLTGTDMGWKENAGDPRK